MTESETAVLDAQISQDLFDLENHVLGFWNSLLQSNAGILEGGSIRTIVLSDVASLVTNAYLSEESGGVQPQQPQGTLLTLGHVTLDIAVRAHYMASADFHQKSAEAVKRVWAERCFHVVERIEKGMVILLPASEEIARQILKGRRWSKVDNQRVIKIQDLEILVWMYPFEQTAHYAGRRSFQIQEGIYEELKTSLKRSGN